MIVEGGAHLEDHALVDRLLLAEAEQAEPGEAEWPGEAAERLAGGPVFGSVTSLVATVCQAQST